MPFVLIVDDDEDDREFLIEACREINPTVQYKFVRSCLEMLKTLKSPDLPKPDIIFLDHYMPHINGVECLKKLKEDASLSRIPIAMITGSTREEDKNLALAAGANHFFLKPSKVEGFCEIVKQVFDAHLLAK